MLGRQHRTLVTQHQVSAAEHRTKHIASMTLRCALAPDTHHSPDSVSTAPLIMIMGRYEKLLGARDHANMTFPASNDL